MKEIFLTTSEGEVKDLNVFLRFCKTLGNGRWLVKFESKNKHSTNQRGYYWSTIVPHVLIMLRDKGFHEYRTKEDAHEFCKYMCNPVYKPDIKTGEQVRWPGSTKRMTKERYMQYIDDVLHMTAEEGYYIPEPINSEEKYKQVV